MRTEPSVDLEERRSRRFWIWLVLAFFALDLTIAIFAIVMAAGDPSFRPMPEYGEKGIDWETHQQARLRSAKLGWTVVARLANPERNALELTVVDRAGQPVVGAQGSVAIYHLTRAGQVYRAELEDRGQGRYVAAIDLRRPGLWKMEARLLREALTDDGPQELSEEFLYEVTTDFLPASAVAQP